MHQTAKTGQCLICHGNLNDDTSLYSCFYHPQICQQCLQKFKVIETELTLYSCSLLVLYEYNEYFRKLLYQYKALDDYALKDVFLCCFPEFKRKYRDYIVVVIPSSKQDNIRRGFCPNEELAKTFSSHIFTGIYKISNYKQTRQKNRSLVKNILKINNGNQLYGKKVLIFDDVMTSSNTVQAAISLVASCHPQQIEILVLSCPHIQLFLDKLVSYHHIYDNIEDNN